MKIMLLGAPGVGKGTQAKLLEDKLQLPQISTGDMLRSALKRKTKLGLEAKKFMDAGLLVPDELIVNLVKNRIMDDDAKKGFLFDGFPRTIPQAVALMESNIIIDYVIEISVSNEEIISRLSGRRVHMQSGRIYHIDNNPPKNSGLDDITGEPLVQRSDDNEDTIKNRLHVYQKETSPLIEFYRNSEESKTKYITINGSSDVNEVHSEIINRLFEKNE